MKKLLWAVVIALLMLSLLAVPVSAAKAKTATWTVPGDFATIQEAVYSTLVAAGDTISVAPGNHAGAYIDKPVKIRGKGHVVISSGPLHGSGQVMGFRLLAGSDGTQISHLQFETSLAIMNGGAVDDVIIEHCTFTDTLQAISNWCGNGWVIRHNKIIDLKTSNGGGIGIIIGDYTGGVVEGNEISHNKINGTLHVGGGIITNTVEKGGYAGSGIVLYADFRWGASGASAIKNNKVTYNDIEMVSDNPGLVDIVAFEMTDTRDNPEYNVIFDNAVGFNDFRGTATQIALTPDNLGDYNYISRNLGDNRGHGLHPSFFK